MPTLEPRFDWLSEPRLGKVLGVLNDGGEARFVGGCVRDALLGMSPLESDAIDIDIATDRTPDEMKALFDTAGIRWIATGEAHGTLTAIEDGLVTECTTLRADVETDGRHAEVRFTRNWDEDWRRRDFTINALYADHNGTLIDPVGGQKDLAAGLVRFIGDPAERIKEDALRILRFFRFSARFAATFDAVAMEAIRAHTDLLYILSKERIWSELGRTFHARRAPDALKAADAAGVLAHLLPGAPRLDVFAHLHTGQELSAALNVAAIWPGLSADVLKRHLKPSNQFLDDYAAIEDAGRAVSRGMQCAELLYRFGREIALQAAALLAAEGRPLADDLLRELETTAVPRMPFSGKDLIAKGLKPGPAISQHLKAFEKKWLEAGAPIDPQHQEQLLDEVLGR